MKCFPENKKILNKCQSSPLLPGVTASPKESSSGMTGTPALELMEFADPGWESHCLSGSPGSFLMKVQPGLKRERILLL